MTEWDLTPEQIKERLDKMVWSFSRVSSFGQCNYEWYLKYILNQEKKQSYYGALGSFTHKCLEMFLKGELSVFDIAQYFEENYADEVPYDAPANKYVDLKQKDYDLIYNYFLGMKFEFDKYEILGVEMPVKFKVGKYDFQGYIDALYRDKTNGEIIMRDHKTTSFKYIKKTGEVSKTNAEHFKNFRRQEYLYCIPIIEKYGKVDKLTWNMVKDGREIVVPFDAAEFEETKQWCINEIENIEHELLWLPNTTQSYYCNVLCSAFGCPYKE